MKNKPHAHAKPYKPFFRASLRSDGTYELLIYEDIGENWWSGGGITAKSFKQELDRAGTYSRISLRINSPGGDAFEGVAIRNMLRAQGKPVDVYVDGLAASAASIIAMAGDTITMGSGAMMMIHNAWSICLGSAADMEKQANALNAIDDSIAQVYAERTGVDEEEIESMMDAETWLGADECVERGFATAKAATEQRGADLPTDPMAMARGFKALNRYAKVPKQFRAEEETVECECSCAPCGAGDCKNCMNASCEDANCKGCPMQAERENASAHWKFQVTGELLADLAIPRMAAAMASNGSRGLDLDCKAENVILAVRRVAGCTLNLAPQASGSNTTMRVSGLVAPYDSPSGDMGGFREVYKPGCFDKWLAGDDPRVLAYHNIEKVLGRKSAGTAHFWSDPAGLHYDADLPDTQAGRDLKTSMERKDVRESSAAFYILDYAWENRSGVRTRVINEARLVEASPYSFPAYTDSTAEASEGSEEVDQIAAANELELHGARLRLLKIA